MRMEGKMRYAVFLICHIQITGQVAVKPSTFTLVAFLWAMCGCKPKNLQQSN